MRLSLFFESALFAPARCLSFTSVFPRLQPITLCVLHAFSFTAFYHILPFLCCLAHLVFKQRLRENVHLTKGTLSSGIFSRYNFDSFFLSGQCRQHLFVFCFVNLDSQTPSIAEVFSDCVYSKTPFSCISGKETRRISRRSVAWLAALKHQRSGEHQRHTRWHARHRKETVQDLVQTCLC